LWKIIHFIENHSIIINQRFDGMPIAFNTEISVMKKAIILFFSLFMVVGIVQAQLRKVPSVVTNAFTAQYPTATNVTWKDNLTNFEAQFDLSGNHTVAKFKSGGEWIETQKDLAFDGLSSAVKDGFNKSKYNDWPKEEIKEISEKNKATVYRIYIRKADLNKRYLYFNSQGQLLRDALTL
jgi:archaellum component FlaF (FlaF/FlaG flagellin family)